MFQQQQNDIFFSTTQSYFYAKTLSPLSSLWEDQHRLYFLQLWTFFYFSSFSIWIIFVSYSMFLLYFLQTIFYPFCTVWLFHVIFICVCMVMDKLTRKFDINDLLMKKKLSYSPNLLNFMRHLHSMWIAAGKNFFLTFFCWFSRKNEFDITYERNGSLR